MDDFYVGYFPKAPKFLSGWLLKVVTLFFAVGLVVAAVFLFHYEESSNSTFEYGIYKELTGTVYRNPVPVIKITTENSARNIVLVNFGKAGVIGILNDLEDSLQNRLENYEITLKGSLIYYDGVTLLELSQSKGSVVDIKPINVDPSRSREDLGQLTFNGELVDSKCYFGVMKPAFGKIHRSCAVRCISGGIPIAVTDQKGSYFFIAGTEIEPYLDLIGKNIQLNASAYRLDNLNYLDVQDIKVSEVNLGHNQSTFSLVAMPQNLALDINYCEEF